MSQQIPVTPKHFSIVIPVLNEATIIVDKLQQLQSLRTEAELILVDGGSEDNSVELASPWIDQLVRSKAGRARQMNAGAAQANGTLLLFLHLDTELPEDALPLIKQQLDMRQRGWGRFDVSIRGQHWLLPVIAFAMNQRSRLTGIATGDQAMFMQRSLFQHLGGFPDQPLMEDIELSKRLLSASKPCCLLQKASTSGRRWQQNGAIRTILLMWSLRFAYWRGASPISLAKRYGYNVEEETG